MDRQEQLRRAIESSPGTATLGGAAVGRGNPARLRKHKCETGRGRAVNEVGSDRWWPSVSEAARVLHVSPRTIVNKADRGKVLRWA